MRAVILVIVFAVGFGCVELADPSNPEVEPPDGAFDAAAIVVTEWSERLPSAEGLILEDLPPIRWFEGECLDYGNGRCPNGRTTFAWDGDTEIHVLVRPTIHESALAHEILHWSLSVEAGNPDGDHAGGAWTELEDVEEILRSAGL